MLRVTVSHDGKDAVYTIVPRFTFAQLRAEACKHFGLRTVDGSSKAPSRRWQLCTQEGSVIPDGDQVPMVSGQKFIIRELSEATTAAVKVAAQMTPPHVPSPSTRLAPSGARPAVATTPTRPRQPAPSALSAIAASLTATAASPGTFRHSPSVPGPVVPDAPATATAAAGGSTGTGRHAQPPHLGVVGRAPSAFLVVAETVKPILSSFLAGQGGHTPAGGSSMRLTPRTGLAVPSAHAPNISQPVDFSSELDASEWLASLSGLPSFLLLRVWRSVSVGCLSLLAQQPAPTVAALPRPITHIPVLPGPTAAFLAVTCTDAAASVRVCGVEDVHGLLSVVSSYVPGWPMWPLGAPTPWTPLASLLAVMAHLSVKAAALSQEHALGMSLHSAHGLLDEGSQASLRSLREALSGRILRKATAMLAHIVTRSTPVAPYNLALERVPPVGGLSILSPLRLCRSTHQALLPPGCPTVLSHQVHKITALLMDAWLTRPADASAASQGQLHTGLVKLASAYSLPSSGGLSFHRLMSLCSDIGWVKNTGLPLQTWMAIFLTLAQREVNGGGVSPGDRGHVGGRQSSYAHRRRPLDDKLRSAGPAGRRSDITVGTVRPWHSDDPLADDPLEEGPEGDGEEEESTPPVLSSPSALALQSTGRSVSAAGGWTRSAQRTVQAQRRGRANDAAVQALLMQTTIPASAFPQVTAMIAVVHSLHMLVPLVGHTAAEQKLTLLLDHPTCVQQVVVTLCSRIQEQGSLGLPVILQDVMGLLLPPSPANPMHRQDGKQLTSAPRSMAATTLLLPLVLLSLHGLLQLSSSSLVKQRVETLIGSRVWECAAPPVFSSPTATWGASSTPGLASPHHMMVTGSSNASWPSKLLLESGRLVCTRFFSLRTADQGGVGYPGVDRRRIALVLQRLYASVDPGPLLLRVAQGLSPPAPSTVSQQMDYLPLLEHARLTLAKALDQAHAHAHALAQTAAQGRSDAAAAGRAAALSVSSAGKDPSSRSSRARGGHESVSDSEGNEGSGAEGTDGEGDDNDEDRGSQSTRGSAWQGGESEEEDAREQEKIGAYLTMKARARAQHEASNREAAFVLSRKHAGIEKQVDSAEAAGSSVHRTALPEPIAIVVLSSTDARALRAASENAADVYGMVSRALGYSTGARRGLEHLAMTGTPLSPSVEAFRQAWLGPTSDAEPSDEMNGDLPATGSDGEGEGDGEQGLAARTITSTLARQGLSLQSPGAAHVLQQATNSIIDAAYWDGSVGESDLAMCHSLVPPPPPPSTHERATSGDTQLSGRAKDSKGEPAARTVPTTVPVVDATLPAEDADTTESETDQLRRVVAAVTGTGTGIGIGQAPAPATSVRARAVDVDPTELSADIELALSSGVDEPRSGRRAGGRGEGSAARPGTQEKASSSPPDAKLHLRDTGLGMHVPAPAILQSLSASRASVVAAWSTPEGAWSRLRQMITRIEEARAKLEQASTALYVMCSSPFETPTSLGELRPLPVEDEVSLGTVSSSTADHPAAVYQTLSHGKIKPLDPVQHSSATSGSFMSATASARAVSGVETSLRTSISWGEYHAALLCTAQAQAIMEAVQWKQIMDERALARDMQSLSTSSSMKDAGSGQIHPECASTSGSGPVASVTHVQLVLPATAIEIESYEEADADQLLARACMHLERALLIRPPPWSAALTLLAQVLLQRSSLTFPVYLTATAKVATNSSLKLPLPSPPALLQPLSQESTHGSRVHVAAGRFAHSWFHDRPTAISMLLTAREALRAALQPAAGTKAAAIDAGITAACETLGYQISASLAVQGLLSDCSHAFGTADAHMFRVIADAAAAKGRPQGAAGSVSDASGGNAESAGAAKSSTGVVGPVHWGSRLSLPLYAPAYAHATATGDEKKQKVAVLSGAGLLLAWKLFSLLDRDGDGMLQGPELARAWTALGPQIDPTLAAWAREEETEAHPLSMDARLAPLPSESAADGLFRRIEKPSARAGVAVARWARLSAISCWLSTHFSAGFAVPRLDPLASSDAVPSQLHSSSPSLSVAVWAVPYSTSLDTIRRRLLARASKHSYKAYSYLQQEGFVYQPYLYASGALSFFDLPLAGSAQGFDRTWAVSSSANVYAARGALASEGAQPPQALALDEAAGLDGPATLSILPSCWVGAITRALRISGLKKGKDVSSSASASRLLRALRAPIRKIVAEIPPAAANRHADKQPWKHVVHRVPTLTRKSAVCYTSTLGGPTSPSSLSPLTAPAASVQLSVAVALGAITGQQGDDMAQAAMASSSSGIHGVQSGMCGGGFTFPAFAEFCAWLACTDPLRLCEPLLKVGLLAPLPAIEAYSKAPVSLRSSWRVSRRPLLSGTCAAPSMCRWLSLPAQLNTPLALRDLLQLKEEQSSSFVEWPSLQVYLSPSAEVEDDAAAETPSRVAGGTKASTLDTVYASLFPTLPSDGNATDPLVLQGAIKVDPDGGETGSSDSMSESSSGSGTLTVTSDDDPEGRLTGSGSNGPQSEGGRSRVNTSQTPRARGFSGLSSYARLRSDDEREEEEDGAGLGGSGGGTVRKRISGRRRNNLAEGLDAILQPSRRKDGPQRPHRVSAFDTSGGGGDVLQGGPGPMGGARKSSIFNLRSRTAAAAVAAASDTYGIAASYGFTASARPASPPRAGQGQSETSGGSTALPVTSSSAGLLAGSSAQSTGQQATVTAVKPGSAPQSATELEEELLARAAAEEAAKDAAARLIAREQRSAQREQRRKERQGRQAQAAQGIVPARKAFASNQSYSTGHRSRGDSAALSGTSLSQSAASMPGQGLTSTAAPDRIHRQRSSARLERPESFRTRSVSTAHPYDTALYISTPARARPPSFSMSSSVGPGGPGGGGQGGGNTTPTWTMVTPARRPSGASGDTGRDTHVGAAGNAPNAAGIASAMKLARIRAAAGPAGMSASSANLSARGVGNSARASESSRWEAPPSKPSQPQPQPARPAPSGGGAGLEQSSAASSVALTYGGTGGTTAATAKFKDVKQASALSSSPLPIPTPGPFPGLPAYAFDGTYREDEEQDGPLKANAGVEVNAGQNESVHRQVEAAAAAIHGPNGMDAQPYIPSTTTTTVVAVHKPPVSVGPDGKVKIDRIASDDNASQSMFITPGVQPASSAQAATTISRLGGLAVALVSRLKLPPGQAALVPAALAVIARTAARRARTTAYLAGVGKANERPLHRGPLGSSPPRLFDYYACIGRGPLLPDVDVMGSRGPEELEYRPDVISRVPKENWRGSVLPSGLGEMVFATGMRLAAGDPSSSSSGFTQPSPQLLTLVFTNDIGTRLYAACVIVWEPLHADPGEFLDALRHAPSSSGPMDGEGFTSGGEESAASGPKAKAAVVSKRPVAIPIWLLPAAVGKKLKAPDSPTLDKVWTPKAHILLSRAPAYSAMFATLRQLVSIGSEAACRFADIGAAMSSGASAGASGDPALRMYRNAALAAGQASVDKAILPIILDVPMPPQGLLSIGFTVGSAHVIAARPPPNAPSMADVPLTPLFMCLDASNVLAAIVALLTNQRIVLCSKHTTILPLVAEALMSLLSPFQWVFPYVPLCRLDDPDTLGSPLGITGWPSTMESAQAANAYAVFVDLDNNVCSTFDPLPVIPEAQRKKLLRTLRVHAYGSGGGGVGTDRATGSGPFLFRQAARAVGDGPAYGADHNPALRRWLAHQTARWAATGAAFGDGGRNSGCTHIHELQLAMIPLAAAGLVINPREEDASTPTSAVSSAVTTTGNIVPPAQGSRPAADKDNKPPSGLAPTKPGALPAAEGSRSALALPIPSLAPPWYTNAGQHGGHFHGGSVPLSALAQSVHPVHSSGPQARPDISASERLSKLCFGWRWESEGHASKSGAQAKNAAGSAVASGTTSGVSSGDEANAVDSDEGKTAVVKRTHKRAVTVMVDVDVPATASAGSAAGSGSAGNPDPTVSPRDLPSPADTTAAGERLTPGTDPLSGLSMSFHAQSIRDGVMRLILSLFKRYGKYTRYHVVGYASASASAAAVHRIIVAHEASKALKGAAASAEPPPLPPLPLPVLRVSFDAQAFLTTEYPKTFLPSDRTDRNKDARELAAQILRTQMWQTSFLDEGLVPTIYRGVPMPGSVPATPVPWDPAREDPFFHSRLHPSIRRFNALVNAKLNRLAGQNTYSIFGTKAAPKLDTSFLEDNSYAITRHIAFPPPLPPGASVPPDVGAALSALASMAAGMVAGTLPAPVGGSAATTSPVQSMQDSMSVDPTLLLSPALGALGTWTGGSASRVGRGGGATDGRIAAAMASARAAQGRRMSRIPLVQGRGSIVSTLAFDSASAGNRGNSGLGTGTGGSSHWPSAMGGTSADAQEYSRGNAQPAVARTRAQVAQGRRESSRHLVNVQLATGGGGGGGSRPGTATGTSAQASMFVARQSRTNQGQGAVEEARSR